MSADDLKDLKQVYLIWGKEDLLLEEAVGRLRDRLAAVADLTYNMHSFDGENADVSEILVALNTLPLMSERKLVVVKRTDRLGSDALGVLAEYCADPAPYACLVLVADKVDRRWRIFKAVEKLGGLHEYAAPSHGQYPAKVVSMFGARGKRIGADAAELLVDAVGRDLRRLAVEVEKACAFVGDRDTLSRDDIESVMSLTAPTSVWEYLEALGARDARGALRMLSSLLAEGESVFAVWALSVKQVRQMIAASALAGRGEGRAELMREVGMADWQARRLEGQAARFAAHELERALVEAAATEAEMKTSRDPRLVFERWIVGLCGSG